MPLTALDRLEALRSYCAPELISDMALTRLAPAADTVPAALTRVLILEVRLGAECDDVDLSFMVGRSTLAQLAAASPASLEQYPVLRTLGNTYRRYRDRAPELESALYAMWVECDAPAGSDEDRHLTPGIWMHIDPTWAHGREQAVDAAAEALFGGPVPDSMCDQLRRCQAALPPRANLLQLGFLPHRAGQALRACLQWVRAPEIPDYLVRVGWMGPRDEVRALLRTLDKGRVDGVPEGVDMLHLELCATPQPRLGIEYALSSGLRAGEEARAEPFLEYLVDLGLCAPAKYEGLCAWTAPALAGNPGADDTTAVRSIKHVKVVYEPGRPPAAKAYLLAYFRPA